jgi:hypothetical protein
MTVDVAAIMGNWEVKLEDATVFRNVLYAIHNATDGEDCLPPDQQTNEERIQQKNREYMREYRKRKRVRASNKL